MIKVWDYLPEYHAEKEEIHAAIEEVLESGWLILGEQVKQFESEFSSYCGTQSGVGVNSGTDALFLGLAALGVGPGDEVITVPNTAVPTVSAIEATGATARFVDIEPDTCLMDVTQLESQITDKTKCLLPVHLYGQCVNMDEVNRVAQKYNLSVFEDCAQAHGAKFNGVKAGAMGDISAFSFYPTKTLGGFGDGGMILCSTAELEAKCRRLRFYGMEKQYYSLEKGYNSRLDELHAAILRRKLKHLDEYIESRREIAEIYYQELSDTSLTLPTTMEGNFHSFYIYVCRHPARDQIIERLREKEIFVNISYPWPIHTMTGFTHLGYQDGDFPESEKAANEVFSLPMYPSLSHEDVHQTCDALKNILKEI